MFFFCLFIPLCNFVRILYPHSIYSFPLFMQACVCMLLFSFHCLFTFVSYISFSLLFFSIYFLDAYYISVTDLWFLFPSISVFYQSCNWMRTKYFHKFISNMSLYFFISFFKLKQIFISDSTEDRNSYRECNLGCVLHAEQCIFYNSHERGSSYASFPSYRTHVIHCESQPFSRIARGVLNNTCCDRRGAYV